MHKKHVKLELFFIYNLQNCGVTPSIKITFFGCYTPQYGQSSSTLVGVYGIYLIVPSCKGSLAASLRTLGLRFLTTCYAMQQESVS